MTPEPISPHFATPERMGLLELDSYRAQVMRELLNEEGQRYIGSYDIVPTSTAFAIAREDWNFDNIERGGDALKEHKPYALIGPGICDHFFTTTDELKSLLRWLCCEGGYLSCYAKSRHLSLAGRSSLSVVMVASKR